MNDKEKELGKQLDYTKIKVKELEENTFVMEESIKESEAKNELLIKQLVQKEIEISRLKTEAVCTYQSKIETFMDVETQSKFNINLIILDEILTNQRSPKDKMSLGNKGATDNICDKREEVVPK